MVVITVKVTDEEYKSLKARSDKNRQSIPNYLLFCADSANDLLNVKDEVRNN